MEIKLCQELTPGELVCTDPIKITWIRHKDTMRINAAAHKLRRLVDGRSESPVLKCWQEVEVLRVGCSTETVKETVCVPK